MNAHVEVTYPGGAITIDRQVNLGFGDAPLPVAARALEEIAGQIRAMQPTAPVQERPMTIVDDEFKAAAVMAAIRALGDDPDERLRQAEILAAAGVPGEMVTLLAQIWTRGLLDTEALSQMARHVQVLPGYRVVPA